MNKLIGSIYILAFALVALPAIASTQTEDKNDCLLYGKNCPNMVDSLPERIAKLKNEIAKGEKVYTPEELNKLKHKLKEDSETIRLLNKPGGRR